MKDDESKNPCSLIVRDRGTGRPVEVPITLIPKELWPETWYDNVYWMHSKALLREEVQQLFQDPEKDLPEELTQKVATYILDYVKNMAVAVWLFNPDKQRYLEYMRPSLTKLSALKNGARTRKDIREMISVCLDCAMDPF